MFLNVHAMCIVALWKFFWLKGIDIALELKVSL